MTPGVDRGRGPRHTSDRRANTGQDGGARAVLQDYGSGMGGETLSAGDEPRGPGHGERSSDAAGAAMETDDLGGAGASGGGEGAGRRGSGGVYAALEATLLAWQARA